MNIFLDAELAELQALPGTAGDMKPPMTQQSKVSFAEGTTFQRERTCKNTPVSPPLPHPHIFTLQSSELVNSNFLFLTENNLNL